MQENGTGHALLIGINYKNQAPKMHLNGALNDIEKLSLHFTNPRKAAYKQENVIYMPEDNATLVKISAKMDELARKVKSEDSVIIYFAGHAFKNGLLTYDNKIFESKYLAQKIEAIKSKKVLVVLDCCHSEGLAVGRGAEDIPLPLDNLFNDLSKTITSRDATGGFHSGEGRVILAACRADEVAMDLGSNGLFTKVLLECLNGQNNLKKDGWVRLIDLIDYVPKTVKTLASQHRDKNGKPWQQNPIFSKIENLGSEDFIICAYDIVQARGIEVKVGEEEVIEHEYIELPPAPVSDNAISERADDFADYEEKLHENNFVMKAIKGGIFEMGSYADDNTQPVRTVQVKDFYLCEIPVTQSLWTFIMGRNPNIGNRKNIGATNPVISIGWLECQNFIKDLNRKTGKHYRLPSEAEWEYAAKANTTYSYSGSDDGNEVAWYAHNSGGYLQPVKTKRSNAWGLYDMSGNAREVCEDDYHPNYANAPLDGSAWINGESKTINKVIRSGSIHNAVEESRVTKRLGWDGKPLIVGFRLAHSVTPQVKEEPITTPYPTIEKKDDKPEIKVVDDLEAFKAKLRQLLDEEQQNAIPEVVKSIKASVYTYDKVLMTALAGAAPMQMAIMANELVRSCALLIESIKETADSKPITNGNNAVINGNGNIVIQGVDNSPIHINTPLPSSFPLAEVQKLVGNGRVDKAIELTLTNIPTNDNTVVLSLQGRLKELKQKEMLGTISNSEANLERNNITVALLTFIRDL